MESLGEFDSEKGVRYELYMPYSSADQGLFVEVEPPVNMEWSIDGDNKIEFDRGSYNDLCDESLRFVGVCLKA